MLRTPRTLQLTMNDTARTRRLSGLDDSFGGERSFVAAANSDDTPAAAARSRVLSDALAPPKHRVVAIGGARNALATVPGFSVVEAGQGLAPPPDPLSASEEWHRFADSHHLAEQRQQLLLENAAELSAQIAVDLSIQKDADDERLATLARHEAEAEAAGFARKETYPLKVEAVNMPMSTMRPYQLDYVTLDGIWHLEQYINRWDNPTMAIAPETLDIPLSEIAFRSRMAQKDIEKEKKETFAKELKQKRKVDRLVRNEGEFFDQSDTTGLFLGSSLKEECKEIQEAAAAEYATIREPVMVARAEAHAEAVEAGRRRRASLELSVEEQMAELKATVDKALNHSVWALAKSNKAIAENIEGTMVETMEINLGPHDPHGAEEGGRNYFEAVAGVEGRVRLDLKQQEQRDREAAERSSEAAAVEAAHVAARKGRRTLQQKKLEVAEKTALWVLKRAVKDAVKEGQGIIDRAQAEKDAAAQKFVEDFERQAAEDEARENTPAAIAAREKALLSDASRFQPIGMQQDKGVSFLKRRLVRKGKQRALVESAQKMGRNAIDNRAQMLIDAENAKIAAEKAAKEQAALDAVRIQREADDAKEAAMTRRLGLD